MDSKQDFKALFNRFSQVKVGVIGDVMLDSYIWGRVDRVSPEAPVPVVSLERKEERIGGAGNVALNCRSLGAQVSIISVAGNDDEAKRLTGLFNAQGIDTQALILSDHRVTTNKTRIISRNQQMMRLDAEVITDLLDGDAEKLVRAAKDYIVREKPSVVIFEDYNKGVLTASVISKLIALCKEHNVLTAVDPKRRNFFSYENVDIFKPNLHEVRDAFHLLADPLNLNMLADIHERLVEKLNHRISFITLSDKGVFYNNDERPVLIPSHLRNVADVSGAGDTVIAVAATVFALTKDVVLMAEIANIAGGLVCEEVGTVAIDKPRLLQECELLLG